MNYTKSGLLRLKALMLCIALALSVLAFASCGNSVTIDSDTLIVIKADKDDEGKTLTEYMTELKEDGKLEFEITGGMVSSINGIDNPADYSSCWMLYTSDAEMANTAWGTVEYDGSEYGSAVLGADALTVKAECIYIWAYVTF